MTGLCLGLAGVVWASLPLQQFTLAWQHSIEKTRWEEDYRVTSSGLVLGEARVRGNGAGMEIPDGAVSCRRCNRYTPGVRPRPVTTKSVAPAAVGRWRTG